MTTYLPWSPASYQPPLTSSLYVQPLPGAHGTDVSPMFGLTSMWPAGRTHRSLPAYGISIGMPLRCW